jgi:hypothetical protein
MIPKCPKCSGEMKAGFVVDQSYAQCSIAAWVAGPAEETLFGSPKVVGREQRPIRTFCCQSCGFLECYAGRS